MPVFSKRTVFGVARGIKMFFNLEAGVARDGWPELGAGPSASRAPRTGRSEAEIKPENIVWILGYSRTGSSWLSSIMGRLGRQYVWFEPYVGEVFGSAYYLRSGDIQREREAYILGNPYKEVWLESIRDFVLNGARARFPEMAANGYLVIKEPNGSIGAPLIMEALPESRMIFLIRDPRDIVASLADASREGTWLSELQDDRGITEVTDAYIEQHLAGTILFSLEKTREAYEAHKGRKVLVRYEDLRRDTLGTMKHLYSTLDIPVNEDALARAVEMSSWENVPEKEKGAGKHYRKATPGGWREDLIPKQAEIVERITAPLLEEFYPDSASSRLAP